MEQKYADVAVREIALNMFPRLSFKIDGYFKEDPTGVCLFLKAKLAQLEKLRYHGKEVDDGDSIHM